MSTRAVYGTAVSALEQHLLDEIGRMGRDQARDIARFSYGAVRAD
jgi:hypothetical protein